MDLSALTPLDTVKVTCGVTDLSGLCHLSILETGSSAGLTRSTHAAVSDVCGFVCYSRVIQIESFVALDQSKACTAPTTRFKRLPNRRESA